MSQSKGRVIAAFPATGKTWWTEHSDAAVDSDSSTFSRGAEWPKNYIRHIREQMTAGKLVLVSTHEEVRHALTDAGIPFVLVYPVPGLLSDYVQRMERRGSPESLIRAVEDNWYRWLSSCNGQRGCEHVILHRGEYLADGLVRLAMEGEGHAWRIGITPDPDAPKSPGQRLYERWREAAGDNAEDRWEALAADIAAIMRDPEPDIADRDKKLALDA